MRSFLQKINKPIYKHTLFWVVVFLFYTTSAYKRFSSIEELLITYFFHVLFQVLIAYSILHIIIPRYRKNKSIWQGIISFLLIFFIINVFYATVWMFYLERVYVDCYVTYKKMYGEQSFLDRITDWKSIYIRLPIFYLPSLFFLVALKFYEKAYYQSKISEQKKIDELKVLRHQLNPHFLFNTLNNLYSLAVEKSDKTPEVIAKLSGMLDYMLYGCDDTFVPIYKEVDLIENYLALEQIRYEDRAKISFTNNIQEVVKIAPLLLLTFIENAFKHGVKHELDIAEVSLTLATNKKNILFTIFNTKPIMGTSKSPLKKSIGLKNVEKQLSLIYPNAYTLTIEDNPDSFFITLELEKR
ncbi:sensor histidine kinase [Tenacibaculum sp. 190524A02b]|uniref:Sensor histidine kinase n=1 Tax=Tenacibaculum vairaonense TaxID=3137860 RepID=A0ABP1FIS3_9FLAO